MIQQDQKKKKNTTPVILGLAVVLILIIAPIGSYIFLRSGFEYRVESLDQLQPKKISSQLDGVIRLKAPFSGNARLVHIPGPAVNQELELLYQIDKKIVDRERFEIYSLTEDPGLKDKHKIQFIPSQHNVNFDEQFILLDTSDVIRGVYPFEQGIEMEIIRHLSVVIPMQKRRSITIKRDTL